MDEKQMSNDELRERERERGMILGMLTFFPIGVALFIATGNPGMIGTGVALGLPIGLAIGERRYKKLIGEE